MRAQPVKVNHDDWDHFAISFQIGYWRWGWKLLWHSSISLLVLSFSFNCIFFKNFFFCDFSWMLLQNSHTPMKEYNLAAWRFATKKLLQTPFLWKYFENNKIFSSFSYPILFELYLKVVSFSIYFPQNLTSLGLDRPGCAWRCTAGLPFHAHGSGRFAGRTVRLPLVRRRYAGAECLLQFSDNPPPGSPSLHPHQSAHNHIPPSSVQGQSLNPVPRSGLWALRCRSQTDQSVKVSNRWRLHLCQNRRPL